MSKLFLEVKIADFIKRIRHPVLLFAERKVCEDDELTHDGCDGKFCGFPAALRA